MWLLARAAPSLTHSVINPTDGKLLVSIPEGLPADVDRAVAAADKAFHSTWGTNVPGFERGKFLFKLAELMERDIDILASLEALDNGKTFATAKGFDVGLSLHLLWFTSTSAPIVRLQM